MSGTETSNLVENSIVTSNNTSNKNNNLKQLITIGGIAIGAYALFAGGVILFISRITENVNWDKKSSGSDGYLIIGYKFANLFNFYIVPKKLVGELPYKLFYKNLDLYSDTTKNFVETNKLIKCTSTIYKYNLTTKKFTLFEDGINNKKTNKISNVDSGIREAFSKDLHYNEARVIIVPISILKGDGIISFKSGIKLNDVKDTSHLFIALAFPK